MSSARLDRFFRASSFRLAAIFALLLIGAFLAAGAGAWVVTQSVAEHQIHERVQLEMNSLQSEFQLEGADAALNAIRTRTDSPGALEYRVTDSSGRLLAGNLPSFSATPGWQVINLPDPNPHEYQRIDRYIILTAPAPGGLRVSIGDDLDRAEDVRVAVLGAISWIGIAALLLSVLAGAAATFRGFRRIDALSNTMQRVSAGDLSARTQVGKGGDDIDVIGRGVNEMLAQIDALVANVRRVSTNIAHDMRTPLTHVRQELEAAATASDLASAHEGIRRAQGKIDEVLRIFAAMLRLAEIEGGSVRARFAPVDLAAVVERVADAYRPDIESSGRSLEVGTLAAASVQGDSDLIAQAIANLLENAMRHTPQGTAISVRLQRDNGGVRLEVTDQGPGVPENERARVLKPFERLENNRPSPGAGLGLSIVNAIAQSHRAELTLSDAGPGLRVTLAWPATLVIANVAAT